MNEAALHIGDSEASDFLLIADHASNRVPDEIDLGVDDALLAEHIAIDIGVASLAEALVQRLDCRAILGNISRLVVDLHRRRDEPNAIPIASDGHPIVGNEKLSRAQREARLERFWDPYHALIAAEIERLRPRLLVGLHSFTPRLASRPEEERPWEVGILYNRDARAARIALPLLKAAGIVTGDNQPYSGKALNATMDLHAEERGLPYAVFEVRQDLIGEPAGVRYWADRLAPVIRKVRDALPGPA